MRRGYLLIPVFFLYTWLGWSCKQGGESFSPEINTLFTLLPASYTQIQFTNSLTYDKDFNIYTYRNFYNGGGVGLGDFNQDGNLDIYFTANMSPNQLYLNEGDFRFEEVTEAAGVGGTRAWSTGVAVADVNGDEWPDIYVCNSGDIQGDNRQNELFIHTGKLTEEGIPIFSEQAEAYGIADEGLSTHGVFFDYDKDGDLDLYLLNNSYQAIGSFNLKKNERSNRDEKGGDKLFRNEGNQFIDVSEEAGIYGSIIGFGLGVTVGDINRDGWQDIYVSNDFFERDYIYINQGDGTFIETLEEQMHSISAASMGADMADINNDGYADIFVTEMLPGDQKRLKTVTTFENWDRYQYNVNNGYYHQFTRNMLQLNNGPSAPISQRDSSIITFSEIGRMAGVHATDWSWAPLITDFDNDGLKDLFVANGIYKDLTDQDYLNFIANEETQRSIITREGVNFKALIDSIPSHRIPNHMFVNQGDLRFENKAKEWGLDRPSHSNGSVYGDLDNDGDWDLVINNANMPAFVYRNESDSLLKENNYLKLSLEGEGKNTAALGATITVRHQGLTLYQEHMPMRGFQSSVDPRPNLGLGTIEILDTLKIDWPDGNQTLLKNVASNQHLVISQSEAQQALSDVQESKHLPIFQEVKANLFRPPFSHQENEFVDFDRDRLIYHMLSNTGPALAVGNVNGDGWDDVFIGGAKDQAGALFVRKHPTGTFSPTNKALWEQAKVSEDTDAVFFDADNDKDLDLYVASGGNEFPSSSSALLDRLYLNDGRGNFTKSKQILPTARFESTSCVKAADYDGDGDQDLFVGLRLRPFLYGVPVNGYILNNDGKGNFTSVSSQIAPELSEIGMITDAQWVDMDGDQDLDLVVVGEWMPITLFENDKGKFAKVSPLSGLEHSHGFWETIEVADLDRDGDMDMVVGNHGLNSRFKASKDKPVCMYINDFDRNGTAEHIICTYMGDESYPLVLKHDLVAQLPGLKKKYLRYENYHSQTIEDIFTPEQLEKAIRLDAFYLETSVVLNEGNGKFTLVPLPVEAQTAPIYSILIRDFDRDGILDLLIGGNQYKAKPEVGIYDASHGLMLKGEGNGEFQPLSAKESGFFVRGEIRKLVEYRFGDRLRYVFVAMNNDEVKGFRY